MTRRRTGIGQAATLIGAVALTSGCSLFSPTTRLEIRPFSESTIAVTSDIRYGAWEPTSVYLRPYAGGPEQLRVEALADEVRALVVAIIAYSVDVVALGRSNLETLADSARGQEKLLDALAVAQPVIDVLVDVGSELLDSLDAQVLLAYDEILAGIERDHAAELMFDGLAKNGQLQMLREVQLLSAYRRGSSEALDSLFVLFPEARDLIEGEPTTSTDLLRVENRITDRFTRLSNAVDQLRPRLDVYYAKLRELEERNKAMAGRLSRGRLALLAWSRGHQRLASGVTNPARIDVGGILSGLARRL